MNPDAHTLLLGLGLGLVAGLVFFGGLYATTRLLSRSWAGVIFAGSFLLRVAVAAGGAWFVATRGDTLPLLAYLLAMIGVRLALVRRVRRTDRVEDA